MKSDRIHEDCFLFSAIQQGDKKAFSRLFRKYYPMLCAYAHRFVEMEDAEEIVQDTLLWLWENREVLIIDTSLSAYLFKMAHRKSLNKLTQQDVINRVNAFFYEKMQETLEDTDYYQIEELSKRIKNAVNTLPPSYREAFIMHRFKHMSYKEIAIELNVSHKTIDYRIQQALKQLKIDFKDYLPMFLTFLIP